MPGGHLYKCLLLSGYDSRAHVKHTDTWCHWVHTVTDLLQRYYKCLKLSVAYTLLWTRIWV